MLCDNCLRSCEYILTFSTDKLITSVGKASVADRYEIIAKKWMKLTVFVAGKTDQITLIMSMYRFAKKIQVGPPHFRRRSSAYS